MIEVYSNLFVGSSLDFESQVKSQPGWLIVQACKEPYHRQALGYNQRSAPYDHPEYFMAIRDNRLILNMVDAPDPDYYSRDLINAAHVFILQGLHAGSKVLVHCNKGYSRAPGIVLLFLSAYTDKLSKDFYQAEKEFLSFYPDYKPSQGMRQFIFNNWDIYHAHS